MLTPPAQEASEGISRISQSSCILHTYADYYDYRGFSDSPTTLRRTHPTINSTIIKPTEEPSMSKLLSSQSQSGALYEVIPA